MMKKTNNKTPKLHTGLMIAQLLVLLVLAVQVTSLNSNLKAATINTADNNEELKAQPSEPKPSEQIAREQAPSPSYDMVALSDDDPFKGDENAPVTIVEWSDFECPFCSRFYSQTLGLIEENYIDTGKVKLVYRDFPLNFHENAQKAAEAGECADDQGKFWEMHNLIFENQQIMNVDNFKKWAADIGLDTEEFNECLDSGKYATEVQKDMQEGSAAGIRGTPGFIINGRLVSGAQPYANFEAAIEAALNE